MDIQLPDPLEGKNKAVRESLSIPASVRAEVDERDQTTCRVCGEYLGPDRRALHHTKFGGDDVGMGGRRVHDPDFIITVGWLPGQDCHSLLHSRKLYYQPYAFAVAKTPGVTVFQLMRWEKRKVRKPDRYHPWSLDEAREAFWNRVKRSGPDDCWPMQGVPDVDGYGVFRAAVLDPDRPLKAHRVAYFFTHDEWPMPACLHSCRNTRCCNPAHLRAGTQTENMEDRKVQLPRFGTTNPNARHAAKVAVIRSRFEQGESQASIARSLHISSGTVSRIVRGINYPKEDT